LGEARHDGASAMKYLRKRPRQARSRATFEAIVEASARILAEHGERALTTNRIAERAGVSVGSLYQYFPDRTAVVRALVERQIARAEAQRPALLDDATAAREARVRALVDWYFDVHAANAETGTVLGRLAARVLPPEESKRRADGARRRAAGTLRSIGLPPGVDDETAVFIVETCLGALCDRAVAQHPDWLHGGILRSEAAALLSSWLARGDPPATRSVARGRDRSVKPWSAGPRGPARRGGAGSGRP
jgi:AcrR family transcriptional regulator